MLNLKANRNLSSLRKSEVTTGRVSVKLLWPNYLLPTHMLATILAEISTKIFNLGLEVASHVSIVPESECLFPYMDLKYH